MLGREKAPFPDNKFPTIQTLCQAVMQEFSAASLRFCIEGKLSPAGQARVIEAQYQDEFYRTFYAIMPPPPRCNHL